MGGAIQSPKKRNQRFQNGYSPIRSSSMKRLQTGGNPWEDEGPDAEYVRRHVLTSLKSLIRDVEWETDQQTIKDALFKIIPDTRDDFGSFRGFATFDLTTKLANEVLKDLESTWMKRLQTVGNPWEDEGPDAEYVRRHVLTSLKSMIRDVEWETDQQTIKDALFKFIPDTRDDFGSFRGFATFDLTTKLANEVLKDLESTWMTQERLVR
jgi:hypothetical protein